MSGTDIAAGLERPTRDSGGAGSASSPIWPCSGWGLPCGPCHQRPGALLPHPFTLACAPERAIGGLLSVALSVASRRPGVTRHPALGSSDFPPVELSRAHRRSLLARSLRTRNPALEPDSRSSVWCREVKTTPESSKGKANASPSLLQDPILLCERTQEPSHEELPCPSLPRPNSARC